MEQYEIIWSKVCEILEKKVFSLTFDVFFKRDLKPISISGNKLVLSAGTELIAEHVVSKHLSNIREALAEIGTAVTDMEIFVEETKDYYLEKNGIPSLEVGKSAPTFNAKYTFGNFVVGNSNKLVYAVASAVANDPSGAFNPLFIYGGTGLGKTHILYAIGNYLKEHRPELSVLYTTSENFTNELIENLRTGRNTNSDFRAKYRSVDVLMIDDIQFIANKTATQEEFFHTFNELYSQNKQIIITSDRPPKMLEHLEDRLRTRFEGGMIADVQAPDLETKMAILQKKAEEYNMILDGEVLAFLAERASNNVRSMEGQLRQIIWLAQLEEKPLNKNFVIYALKLGLESEEEKISPESIIDAVCDYYSIKKEDLIGKKKNKEIVHPRQMCMYLFIELLSMPLAAIGEEFGRDHTTVIHAREKISGLLKTDDRIITEFKDLKGKIQKN